MQLIRKKGETINTNIIVDKQNFKTRKGHYLSK